MIAFTLAYSLSLYLALLSRDNFLRVRFCYLNSMSSTQDLTPCQVRYIVYLEIKQFPVTARCQQSILTSKDTQLLRNTQADTHIHR